MEYFHSKVMRVGEFMTLTASMTITHDVNFLEVRNLNRMVSTKFNNHDNEFLVAII
jgi:hypothetical protein